MLMRYSYLILAAFLTSCSAMMPDLFKTLDDIATDGVIQVQIDKEAFNKNTKEVNVDVKIINQDAQ
jgi:hypothetical protein